MTSSNPPNVSTQHSILNASMTSSNPPNVSTFPLPPGLRLHTRNLLTAYVNHNKATGLWITTINTNQKAKTKSKNLKAFSFRTEHEARETAYVNAPPMLQPFDKNKHCFECEGKFNVVRRAAHCRNCGVCICLSCTRHWKKPGIPETYNPKNNRHVKVCKTCNYLTTAFRHALLSGNYDQAQSIYMTGNVNLRCPFMNVKKGNEIMLPIHCAASGGNLKLLSWLVDIHHCPLKMINTSNSKKNSMSEDLIATSKDRTVLDIAITKQKVDILRYLVQDKKIPMNDKKDKKNKKNETMIALEAVLKAFPEARGDQMHQCSSPGQFISPRFNSNQTKNDFRNGGSRPSYVIKDPLDDDKSIHSLDSMTEEDEDDADADADDEQSVSTTVQDPCVICYQRSIDCVLTPCGHQMCCLECSNEMDKCPICTSSFTTIRIFRP